MFLPCGNSVLLFLWHGSYIPLHGSFLSLLSKEDNEEMALEERELLLLLPANSLSSDDGFFEENKY
jgi:hypothetical protein